jgi:hypothetical protein
MDLRDRIQRWWRPAQWKDDHRQAREDGPSAGRREPPRQEVAGTPLDEFEKHNPHRYVNVESDFKKPR